MNEGCAERKAKRGKAGQEQVDVLVPGYAGVGVQQNATDQADENIRRKAQQGNQPNGGAGDCQRYAPLLQQGKVQGPQPEHCATAEEKINDQHPAQPRGRSEQANRPCEASNMRKQTSVMREAKYRSPNSPKPSAANGRSQAPMATSCAASVWDQPNACTAYSA